MIIISPPDSSKPILTQRLPIILRTMSFDEAIETTKIHSVAGLLAKKDGLIDMRLLSSSHHTIANAGLIGGGATCSAYWCRLTARFFPKSCPLVAQPHIRESFRAFSCPEGSGYLNE
jgi:hypothetical protein